MPPLPPTPSLVARVGLNFSQNTKYGSRFFLAYNGSAATNADCASLAAYVDAAWATYLAGSCSTDLALIGTTVQDLSSLSPGFGQSTTSHNGTEAFAAVSESVSACIDFKIARKYRGGKPKIFLPNGTVNDVADQRSWGSTFITNLNAAWGNFITHLLAFTSTTLNPSGQVNVSYYNGHNTATPPWRGPGYKYPPLKRTVPVVDPITSVATRTIFGSQRRRLTSGS